MIKDELGQRRFFGVYRGKVVNNNDPENRRRLQLIIPQVLGDQISGWAWELEAGIRTTLPSVDQGVWVQFEGGDPSFPIWVGTFGPMYTADAIDGGSA